MKIPASPLAVVVACASLIASAPARETVLVIGDSLSREYQFEFAQFDDARNWVEILAENRPDDFDFGDKSIDQRYRYNWALPTYSAEDYADDLTSSGFLQRRFQDLIDDDFDDVDAVVVFLGGNDIDSVYGPVYNGNSSTTNNIINRIEDDLEDIIDFVQDDTPNMRMILVNVPHVGATPEVKGDHPTHPVRTQRVTDALQTIDTRLRALANRKNIGYADILPFTLDLLSDAPYCIGGFPFINEGSDDGDADHIWLGGDLSQNFHPNTNGQAIVANAIIEAFNEKYGIGAEPLSEIEIVEDIVGLDTPYGGWADAAGLPPSQRGLTLDPDNDGLSNLIEFTLDLDPTQFSSLPEPRIEGGNLVFDFNLRHQDCAFSTVEAQVSSDLIGWVAVPEANIEVISGGTYRVTLPVSNGSTFIRLLVTGG